jgi:uncharacterized protein (TIGR02145 family)
MKKNLLLMMLCCPAVLAAQNGVTVSNLAVDAGTVTFNVQWTNDHAPDFVWSDTVWVFVDYNNNGVMERLPVTSATASAGTVTKIPNNDKGVWVAGNARTQGSFSATVKLFTSIADIGGACVYGSNYPPVGKYTAADKIEFTGTPPYNIVLKNNGGGTETRTESSPYIVPPGYTVQSFTDKTGAPGKLGCIPSTAYNLVTSATAYCAGSTVTFALSNTTLGRTYRLYKDGNAVMNALPGTNGAATFTGTFAGAGTYTAQVVAEGGNCPAVMTGSPTIAEIPLPDNPVVFGASCACAGTVTLSASSSDALIDWYADAATTSKLYTGASYTTPEIVTSTTYYAQARVAEIGCLSARVPVLAEVITEGCCTDFTAFNPSSTAPIGTEWCLTDTREPNNEQTYKVKKMADGRIWMIQDMKFGELCSSANSGSALTNNADMTYNGHCRYNSYAGGGCFYDLQAALNLPNTNGTYSPCSLEGVSSVHCRGLCPLGWHVPTPSEFTAANASFQSYYGCSSGECWVETSEWQGVRSGSMPLYGGSNPSRGSEGRYWASHKPNNVTADYARFNQINFLMYSADASEGLTVRCLRN